jgi:hypothetical protein
MGLKMQMYAERSLAQTDTSQEKLLDIFPTLNGSPVVLVVSNIGFWENSHHIHDWFVEKVQQGANDGVTSYVQQNRLAELKDLCTEVLEFPEKAADKLPIGTLKFDCKEYDESYYKDIRYTLETVKIALKLLREGWEIKYRGSW